MALITVERSYSQNNLGEIRRKIEFEECLDKGVAKSKSVNECYFAVKGAALVLPHDECLHVCKRLPNNTTDDIQKHLESMFFLLRAEDTLKMAVKLESVHSGRTRYLVVVNVSYSLSPNNEESCLLGVDCNNETTIGLVLPVWADTRITLDGDGGFSISSSNGHHIFKPVSVQAMWSALQTLHKVSAKARQNNYFAGGSTHQWVKFYESKINSKRSCLNEWFEMDDIIYKRPPSPDIRIKPSEQEETERLIRAKLKEVMMSLDLDEVTSKFIRSKLENELEMDLNQFKSFIDQEMLIILGQMDEPTEIFEYLYLGSEWNASNLEELKAKGITKILNVTREIDNFFPGMFEYYNVRVYDDDSTEMLKYWDKTYKYIRNAKAEGSKVLVHCKMGISRSASVVIAYVMKAYNWNLAKAMDFVKSKRNCIRPNASFITQLEIYQGILEASKQRHNNLWKSKSETNLTRVNENFNKNESEKPSNFKQQLMMLNCNKENSRNFMTIPGNIERPKSWSPNNNTVDEYLSHLPVPLQKISSKEMRNRRSHLGKRFCTDPSCYLIFQARKNKNLAEFGFCQRIDLQANPSSVKERINEIETNPFAQLSMRSPGEAVKINSRAGFVLNLANQFETTQTISKSKEVFGDVSNFENQKPVNSKPPVPKIIKSHTHSNFLEKRRLPDINDLRKFASVKIYSNHFKCDETFKRETRTRKEDKSLKVDWQFEHFVNDVGFLPRGTVRETKKKIEENNLKRTASFESLSHINSDHNQGYPGQNDATKSHKRSSSLYLSSQKWIPLPALTTKISPVKIEKDKIEMNKSNLTHSRSTPSVFEAVNEVLNNTQVILSSAIESLPKTKTKLLEDNIKFELFNNKGSFFSKNLDNELIKCQKTDLKSSEFTLDLRKEKIEISNNLGFDGVVKKMTKEIEAKAKETSHHPCKCIENASINVHHLSKSTPTSPNVARLARPRASTFNEFSDCEAVGFSTKDFELSLKSLDEDMTNSESVFAPKTETLPPPQSSAKALPVNPSRSAVGQPAAYSSDLVKRPQTKRQHKNQFDVGKSHPLSKLMAQKQHIS